MCSLSKSSDLKLGVMDLLGVVVPQFTFFRDLQKFDRSGWSSFFWGFPVTTTPHWGFPVTTVVEGA